MNTGQDEWTDISMPLQNSMICWPGDPPVTIERIKEEGPEYITIISALGLGSHSGTHIDAPVHYFPEGKSIDLMPPDTTIGKARVIEIQDGHSITTKELAMHHIRQGERILFKTKNSSKSWHTDTFTKDYVYVSVEAARYLVECGIKMAGIDYLSVGAYDREGTETHKILLGHGIWIIEGLVLSCVMQGTYDLICLPLRIAGADGAPARAMIRPVNTPDKTDVTV
jgi:arylformamidase